jgi:hypothetical protein
MGSGSSLFRSGAAPELAQEPVTDPAPSHGNERRSTGASTARSAAEDFPDISVGGRRLVFLDYVHRHPVPALFSGLRCGRQGPCFRGFERPNPEQGLCLLEVQPLFVAGPVEPSPPRQAAPLRAASVLATLEPWLVEATLSRLDRELSQAEQQVVWKATRSPHKVVWPDW